MGNTTRLFSSPHMHARADYLAAMAAASNFAWVNRTTMTFLCRCAVVDALFCASADASPVRRLRSSSAARRTISTWCAAGLSARRLLTCAQNVVYDVSHNIAKIEQHMVDGRPRQLLVHRKGATRAFGAC